MPLSIAAPSRLSHGWWIGLSWAALLLGAALAPTDPVLAADVQVGPPQSGEEDEVRFGLTSEAGLNDGFAFPFVHLAILLSTVAATGEPWLGRWLAYNVLWEIGAGVAAGYAIGRALGWLTFHVPAQDQAGEDGRRAYRRLGDLRLLRADRTHPQLRLPGGLRDRADLSPRAPQP
jgi:NhaP-type Na+/H+ or K+/H+ antiporter